MRIWIATVIVVLSFASCAFASWGVGFGRISYDGDICGDCESEPSTANLYGVGFHLRALPKVVLGFGSEYAHSDFNVKCGGNAELSHYSLYASGTFTFFSAVAANAYGGLRLSYHWFNEKGIGCGEPISKRRTGYHGLLGLVAPGTVSPVRGYIEGRLGRLTGSPGITTTSIYLGIELGL